MGAEDIRDLQSFPGHDAAGLRWAAWVPAEMLQRALDGAQGGAGDLAVARGGIEFLVAQEHLDHADVDLLLQQMGGEAVPERVQRDPLVDPAGTLAPWKGAVLTGVWSGD